MPERTVEADPRSRLADIHDPDYGPLPPDDPAATCYMRHPYKSRRKVEYWDKRGVADRIDSETWLQHLPVNDNGEVVIDKQLAVNLALLHSREFQTQVETLHVSALGLSADRFEFDLNWLGGNGTDFSANGDGADAVRNLDTANNLGFTREFASGGQFVANLVNSFTWSLGGGVPSNFSAGNLVFSLTQPLLRNAFRHVRTEGLTQAERTLLYDVRSFARFRREFYFNVVGDYLLLLNQAEAVRIEEENLRSLQSNLDLTNILVEQGSASQIQVDQVFQDLQNGRLNLINLQQGLQTSEDQFKFLLGLPARVNIVIEDTLLNAFELNSTEVLALQEKIQNLKTQLLDYLPPDEAPQEFLDETYVRIKEYAAEVKALKKTIDREYETWYSRIENATGSNDKDDADAIDLQQQRQLAIRIKEFLDDLDSQIEAAEKLYEDSLDELDILPPRNGPTEEGGDQDEEPDTIQQWKKLQRLISSANGLVDRVATLFVTQNQIRLFLIETTPLDIEEETAIELALENRLDLMNSRGAVVDSYRFVEIAADQLQSDLDINASASLNTDGNINNAFRFDGDENQYDFGVQFDSPLNRFGERNSYRIAQLSYQQQRRAYMADEDAIVNEIRLNLRLLRTNRFNFQIARQQLIAATRQVDEAQLNLRGGEGTDSSQTQDLLMALGTLRTAKINLITDWINYETSRIELFVNLEWLMLDEQGVWINEQENFDRFQTGGNNLVGPTGAEPIDRTPVDNRLPGENQSAPPEPIAQPEFEEAITEDAFGN